MKKISVCILFAACFALFTACEKEKEDYPLGGPPCPPASMMILKFPASDYPAKVIAAQPFVKFIDEDMRCIFADESLSLYTHHYGVNDCHIEFLQHEMPIEGTSPYIPLTDDYFLIDWKWHEIHPVSSFTNYLNPPYPWWFRDIFEHAFLINTDWIDLQDITDKYAISDSLCNLVGTEHIQVTYYGLDRLFGEDNHRDPYDIRNVHNEGLSITAAYAYYDNYDRVGSPDGKSYRTYVRFADSLQAVYQKHLIEIIQNGKINTIGYK